MAETCVAGVTWREALDAAPWDRDIAAFGGHPLQSALWGDARKSVDGIEDARLTALVEGKPVLMARVETRRIAGTIRAAWIPKGPVTADSASAGGAFDALLSLLHTRGFVLCVDDAYPAGIEKSARGTALRRSARTAVIDLTAGRDAVFGAIDKQWRYGVRSAERQGVTVEQSREGGDAAAFFALCEGISQKKGFQLPGSLPLLRAILQRPDGGAVDARLFCAKSSGELIAGAAVIRSGRSLHYFWGGVDRRFPKLRAGEAVQWAVMEWAIENGIERYDLEGIDHEANPGTSAFKMKMGAREVTLPGLRAYPLSLAGRAALAAGRLTGKL